jgi:hypothetical protein
VNVDSIIIVIIVIVIIIIVIIIIIIIIIMNFPYVQHLNLSMPASMHRTDL